MTPRPSALLEIAGISEPLIGLYDAPDPEAFAPVVEPPAGGRACVFAYYPHWREGKTLHLSPENYGCGGAGTSLCDVTTRSREEYIRFLADDEGLRASRELMAEWIDHRRPLHPQHGHILIGPLRDDHDEFLRTVTFIVNPDQLGLLMLGANYRRRPSDPTPVLAPFSSGCGLLVTTFDSLDIPQAVIGATDIAMREYFPPDRLAFTVTGPLFEELCALDERSFLYKPFWKRLRKARA